MADTATATPKAATPKVKKVAKPKAPAAHPKYSEMIASAVAALKERGGSSRQAILKYINANFKVGDTANNHLKIALKAGVKAGTLKQAKGTGASGSFKLGEKPKKVAKKATKPKAAKPKVKKAAKKPAAKKPAAKKPAAKKAKTPKKAAAKPKKAAAAKPKKAAAAKPKKAATKSPKKAKAAAKPKKTKTPKKAAAKK